MQKIPLSLAKEGMKLARPIMKDNGMVLVAEGAELTQTLLDRLTTMRVENIMVKGSPVDMDGLGGSSFAERMDRMDHLFRKHGRDPWMMKLKTFIHKYFQLKAAAEAAARAAEKEARLAETEVPQEGGEQEQD